MSHHLMNYEVDMLPAELIVRIDDISKLEYQLSEWDELSDIIQKYAEMSCIITSGTHTDGTFEILYKRAKVYPMVRVSNTISHREMILYRACLREIIAEPKILFEFDELKNRKTKRIINIYLENSLFKIDTEMKKSSHVETSAYWVLSIVYNTNTFTLKGGYP